MSFKKFLQELTKNSLSLKEENHNSKELFKEIMQNCKESALKGQFHTKAIHIENSDPSQIITGCNINPKFLEPMKEIANKLENLELDWKIGYDIICKKLFLIISWEDKEDEYSTRKRN